MAVFESIGHIGLVIKSRPSPHRLEGITTKRHSGVALAARPRAYPMTSQQKKVRDAAKSCGIHTGMSRSALVTAMKQCLPGKM